eukprot:CAMPEP_0179099592 /NCGR_PEP_ID=MMETSP0796-20121207/45951_1 /TAXON_ID=73915 /ORGANISM="Pyrodinium bahamense, Strain pbaha01" /LENGTH=193 /DNA_ID=CAMNT_0020797391 /DNA_START=64 /DNA_END=643 /DNA_ORIENTATION=-
MAARREGYAANGHRFSELSEKALGMLINTDAELSGIEERVKEIASLIDKPGADVSLFKIELAQLESSAKQLEAKGVDDVYTGELKSGKQMAKASKRDMLQRLEALFSQTDAMFAKIKAKPLDLAEQDESSLSSRKKHSRPQVGSRAGAKQSVVSLKFHSCVLPCIVRLALSDIGGCPDARRYVPRRCMRISVR